uniref:NADH-plastoquinone oxidoreductase subunit 7 n=1 Tax=Commiphora foliacea TaxID=1173001 RepID=A0A410PA33_9ROSI|nr:NADH-plastoquinone oxidoreductase subunit 7 [Commiphora foliacea]QAT19663.1 NADH-plastoquinone oxidoreductase subunit 7 [Commiphora foliacea]
MSILATGKDLMVVNMGPHHPSMHGVLRLIVTLDGEDVIDCEPILGYLHRGMEKIAENRTIIQYLPYVTRWDYLATMFTEAITVNGPEQLGNIQVPKRASYIRVIMLELSRIASHLLWLGPFMADIGAQTPFFYIFRERELVYDLFEAATGMRMMHNYFRIGGIAADLPHGWIDKCLDFCDYFLTGVVEYQKLITRNPIFFRTSRRCRHYWWRRSNKLGFVRTNATSVWTRMGSSKSSSLSVLRRISLGSPVAKRRRFISSLFSPNGRNDGIHKNYSTGFGRNSGRTLCEFRNPMLSSRKRSRMERLCRSIHKKKALSYFSIAETRTLCKSSSPKRRIGNFSDRRSKRFSLEMENSPSGFYQFANSSSVSSKNEIGSYYDDTRKYRYHYGRSRS